MKNLQQKNKEKDLIARQKIQHRKEFFVNIKMLCDTLGGPDIYPMFPPLYLDSIYFNRYSKMRLMTEEGSKITNKDIKKAESILAPMLKMRLIEVKGKGNIPLGVFLVEGFSLSRVVKELNESHFPGALEIKHRMEGYLVDMEGEVFVEFSNMLYDTLLLCTIQMSDIRTAFIYSHYIAEIIPGTLMASSNLYLCREESMKRHFTLDDKSRPAYRLGWGTPAKFEWAMIKPSQLGIQTESDLPMEVYVQSHALIRLEERLGIQPGLAQYLLCLSLDDQFECHHIDGGKMLISYSYDDKKMGYLVCVVQDSIVLIQTFLFLTAGSTPEGKKLFELTGLKKMDKKYLAIDKLQTFLSYNIEDDKDTREIFAKAGCESLLGVNVRVLGLSSGHKSINAGIITKYIRSRPLKEETGKYLQA